METIHFPDDPRPSWLVHPVLALGNFDGFHLGHQAVVGRAVARHDLPRLSRLGLSR